MSIIAHCRCGAQYRWSYKELRGCWSGHGSGGFMWHPLQCDLCVVIPLPAILSPVTEFVERNVLVRAKEVAA